jgi:hypothetical protein
VILTSHTHDALPEVIKVGNTLLIASGSHGKFVSRLDLDVQGGAVKNFRYKLIPLFADAIKPDPELSAAIAKARAPFAKELARTVGTTESVLFRRGNFNGTFDDLICAALLKERDAEIALSPGISLGHERFARTGNNSRRHPQRHGDHLSAGLSHVDDWRTAERNSRGCRRQSVQSRSVLSAGRRHGALWRASVMQSTSPKPIGQRISAMTAPEIRRSDRTKKGIRGRRLGQRQRRHRRPAGLGAG